MKAVTVRAWDRCCLSIPDGPEFNTPAQTLQQRILNSELEALDALSLHMSQLRASEKQRASCQGRKASRCLWGLSPKPSPEDL